MARTITPYGGVTYGTVRKGTPSCRLPRGGERHRIGSITKTFVATSPTEPHPIDVADAEFFIAALCGTGTSTLAGPAFRPRLIDRATLPR
jgi:hypothetical protein